MKLVALVVVGLLALAGWCAPAQASVRCVVRGHALAGVANSRVLSARGDVVVYRVRREHEQVRLDTIRACDRSNDRVVRLGEDESVPIENIGGLTPNRTLEHLQIDGPWVLATQTGNEDATGCFKYELSSCDGPSNTLIIANAALGLVGSLASIRDYVAEPGGHGYVETLERAWTRTLLSTAGAVAWLEESGPASAPSISLYGCLARAVAGRIVCAPLTHAEGEIERSSVALSQTSLSWMAGGSAHTAIL